MSLPACVRAFALRTALSLSLAPAASLALQEGDFTYEVDTGHATITGFDRNGVGPLDIPDILGGFPVTTIGNSAFSFSNTLTSVTIPDSVAAVGDNAFSRCTALTSVAIPDSVHTIGAGAFSFCNALNSVTIPASVNTIGDSVLGGCPALANITVSPGNAHFTSINGVLFDIDKTTLIQFPAGKSEAYAIPESVTTISYGAFVGAKSLRSVTIPGGVTTIGPLAFNSCESLVTIVIPGSVTTIGGGCFYFCTSLTSVFFEGDAPSTDPVGTSPFPATVYYLATNTGWINSYMGRPAVLWNPRATAPNFDPATGVTFTVYGNPDLPVAVEATADFDEGEWTLLTNTTLSGGSLEVADPTAATLPRRLYRITWPR